MKVPKLVNIKDVKSQALYKPMYIGLGSPYGNSYSQEFSRARAVRLFEEQWRRNLGSLADYNSYLLLLERLDGTTMLCYCHPKYCHGDVLIKLFKEVFHDKIEVSDDQRGAGEEVGQ